jgi:predicted glycoside hydrolase/deacetylase ChbG (UPF0249 family)
MATAVQDVERMVRSRLMEEPARVRLIVNADGFGASPAASAGILRAHRDGLVTSTSVLGNAERPDELARLLGEAPNLGVGVHLALTGGGPVSAPDRVRSLVGEDGRFCARVGELALRWARGQLVDEEVERELEAQLARLLELGLPIDHLDTHASVGFLPIVGRTVETIAKRHGIPGIRSTMERPTLTWITDVGRGAPLAAMTALAWVTRRQLGALRHGPQTWGYSESGRLDVVRVLEILGRLGPGAHELMCHPTTSEPGELAALTSPVVRDAVRRREIELVRWRDVF